MTLLTSLQQHMLRMFVWLRIGVGVIGLSLPVLLFGCGKAIYHVPFAGSMSAYYHATSNCWEPYDPSHPNRAWHCDVKGAPGTPSKNPPDGQGPLRNWFVGNLCFIGAAMFLMRGFSIAEDVLLDIAGLAAVGVALIPMSWGDYASPRHLHMICAVTFFLCAGATCIFCSGKTLAELPEIPGRAKVIARYKAAYFFLGTLMWAAPACVFFLLSGDWHQGFWLEAAGVSAFGSYWLVKTFELRESEVERRVLKGELHMERTTLQGRTNRHPIAPDSSRRPARGNAEEQN